MKLQYYNNSNGIVGGIMTKLFHLFPLSIPLSIKQEDFLNMLLTFKIKQYYDSPVKPNNSLT